MYFKLHPALKYYALSKFTDLSCYKSLITSLNTTRPHVQALTLKALNLTNRLVPKKQARHRFSFAPATTPLSKTKPFLHKLFNTYKSSFWKNMVPLVGNIPSYYLTDIKPIKSWKFLSVFPKSGDTDSTHVRLKSRTVKLRTSEFKQATCKRTRLRLVRKLLHNNVRTPSVTQSIWNFKSLTRRLAKFKPVLKRIQAPVYVSKWKTSYPLMFTGSIATNRLLRPKLDLTIKTFIQSRSNKRVRRFKKVLFRKIKRLNKFKQWVKFAAVRTRSCKRKLLTVLLKNRLKRRRGLITLTQSRRKLRIVTSETKIFSPNWVNPRNSYIETKNLHLTGWDKSLCSQTSPYCLRPIGFIQGLHSRILASTDSNPRNLIQLKHKLNTMKVKLSEDSQQVNSLFICNNHPYIRPRTNKNFIFRNFGVFLTTLILFNQKKPFSYKYLFKKKIFSFLYPNEVRNTLMIKKKKIVFYKLVYKLKHRSKQKVHYSFASFNKTFINHYKTSLQNKSNAPITRELFSKLSTAEPQPQNASSLINYIPSRDEILYDQNFIYRGVDLSFKRTEVKIPRVRFRPGYQRMWRSARNALKESMGLKFVYQQQLTRHLVRFYKNSNKYTFSRSEMSANKVIMYSRLLPDNPTVNIFIDQRLIYLNGRLLHTQQTILVPNDLVQLIVSIWYYVAYRWISNWTLKRHKKFKKLVYRKGLAGKHKIMKLKKQRSYYTPNWIYLARYDISDVKPFLEVDYLTLSMFVLYEPFITYSCTPDESPDFRPNIYRMYNWKYIT